MTLFINEGISDYKVVGLDPGGDTFGVSLLSFDEQTKLITVQTAFTVKAIHRKDHYRRLEFIHGEPVAKRLYIRDRLYCFFNEAMPNYVQCEGPYMGSFIKTFASLTSCVESVAREALIQYNSEIPMDIQEPMRIKKRIGVNLKGQGKGDKEGVRKALAKRDDLIWKVDLNILDEHSVDAVAVALYHLLDVI